MKTKSALLIGMGLLQLAAFARAQEQTSQMIDPNRVVMVVNGEEIKGAEYYRRMEFLAGVGTRSGNSFTESTPGFLTAQQLVNERLIFALAKEKGVYPSDDEVADEIKVRQEDNPKVLQLWTEAGGTLDELRYQIRVQLAEFKIKTQGVTKTDAEVEQFYKDHPDLYTTPKLFKLRLIAVSTPDDTKAVDQELAGGKDFASVAREKSVDATKNVGGDFPAVPEYDLAGAARDALKDLKPGQTTKWLTSAKDGGNGAYLKFELEAVIPEKKHELDASLMRQIRRKLMVDMGQVKNPNVTAELAAERTNAKVETKTPASLDPNQLVDPNRVIFTCNGEEIKGSEYYRRMEYLENVGVRVSNSFSELPPGFLTIQQLIRERLIFGLAKDKGIYPTDEEVDGELKVRLGDSPKMLDRWAAGGRNVDELKYVLRLQIAQFKVQTFGITITDTEVEDYYKAHPDLYTAPKQYKLRLIAVNTEADTKAVDQDLAAGKDFAATAKERSADISKLIGGDTDAIPEYELSTKAREALAGTKIGEMTNWISGASLRANGSDSSSGSVYLKLLLENIVPAKKMELSPALRRLIRRELMAERGIEKNGAIEKQIDQQRTTAKIDIKQAEFADAWQRYLKAAQQMKGSTQ